MHKNRNLPAGEKAQVVLLDLLFACLVFLLVFSAINKSWENDLEGQKKNIEFNELVHKAILISDTLVKSAGEPENWHELDLDSVELIGLAQSNLSIGTQKVNRFKNLDQNYLQAKELLQIPQYDYFFQLEGNTDVFAGIEPPEVAEKAVVRRIVEFEGGEAVAVFTLYKIPE